ncbi:hypothetical protein CfE428DRAFT_2077 [Chthoniobacter flavus Ellin428]|uniref:O-methyltransferase-like protein n=1 Tax=Chthoniobacter flavus Ellin428 TaxID=497964 RepID=B4CZI9_9BACT|nr:class I SAM-dependent methyltransferase [Chthoniobacter flavus]EDY20153.1 hypothetical protein CfE428DRAFT_2077 [Chthoniobacter flavus Ellin428]TCO94051.1 methyltransferase family protein [Chthoniobacter flavus]
MTPEIAETIPSWNYHAYWDELRRMEVELPQHSKEFQPLMQFVEKLQLRNLVEVGTREGGSLFMLSRILPPGSTIISVDLPGMAWGRKDSGARKQRIAERLRADGFTVHLVERDSSLPETATEVARLLDGAPIEALFLDGDHAFDGVLADFRNYQPLMKEQAPIIFHDIAKAAKLPKVEVHYLWRLLKTFMPWREFVAAPENGQGIGIVLNTDLPQGFDLKAR